MTTLKLNFLTPLFSKGSYENHPEIRPPSIRGQIHWWFRALGGSLAQENAIFGSVHAKPISASKIIVRTGRPFNRLGGVAVTAEMPTLPHKKGGLASPKWAFLPGTCCELHFLERLGGLSENDRLQFQKALEAWLLLGTLGLRATRAAGSFDWEIHTSGRLDLQNPPDNLQDYAERCSAVFDKAPLRFFLIPKEFDTSEEARTIVSDTIGGRSERQEIDDLARLNHPLGHISKGRKTSPLRFRILRMRGKFFIAAVWDDRNRVTGNRPGDFEELVQLLANHPKKIGEYLKDVI